jgi:RimJ/RimL family protein N-acetyltransferase
MALLPEMLSADGLELRSWNPTFVDAMLVAIQESLPGLQLWMPWAQAAPTEETLRPVLAQGEEDFNADRNWDYSIFEERSGDLVGGAGLHRTRRGHASSAAGALVEAAFRYLSNASQIVIRMDVANLASASVPPKLGFPWFSKKTARFSPRGTPEEATCGHCRDDR